MYGLIRFLFVVRVFNFWRAGVDELRALSDPPARANGVERLLAGSAARTWPSRVLLTGLPNYLIFASGSGTAAGKGVSPLGQSVIEGVARLDKLEGFGAVRPGNEGGRLEKAAEKPLMATAARPRRRPTHCPDSPVTFSWPYLHSPLAGSSCLPPFFHR